MQVKRKEPLEFEEGDMKRPRPSTPPDEDDEGLLSCNSGFKKKVGLLDLLHVSLKLSCFQLLTRDYQRQTGMELKGTTRGGKRSQEIGNPGSLTVREKKHLMVLLLKRFVCLF